MNKVELAELYGYETGRCPQCRKAIATDTGYFVCDYCGWEEEEEEDDENG